MPRATFFSNPRNSHDAVQSIVNNYDSSSGITMQDYLFQEIEKLAIITDNVPGLPKTFAKIEDAEAYINKDYKNITSYFIKLTNVHDKVYLLYSNAINLKISEDKSEEETKFKVELIGQIDSYLSHCIYRKGDGEVVIEFRNTEMSSNDIEESKQMGEYTIPLLKRFLESSLSSKPLQNSPETERTCPCIIL